MDNLLSELPIGFGMHLAQNQDAMTYFAGLNEEGRREVVNQSKNVASKEEMLEFVSSLGNGSSFKA